MGDWGYAFQLVAVLSRSAGRQDSEPESASLDLVVIAAKTAEPHPKLPGTIYSAAEEIF